MATVYKITNIQNGKMYIGVTSRDIKIRYKEHKKHSNRNHSPIYLAIQEFGIEFFKYEILEKCQISDMYDREKYWINILDTVNNGYNVSKGGTGNSFVDYSLVKNTLLETLSIKETSKILGYDKKTLLKFAYKENIYHMMLDREIQYKSFSNQVVGITKNNEVLNFNSTHQASLFCISEYGAKGKSESVQSHIADVCKGKRKSAYGVVWKYL